jgi:hypothetical protein
MQRIKKAYAENGDKKIIPEAPPLDGSENWEQGRGSYYELDNDPNTGDPLALDIDREQDNYFKNVISNNIKHWQENTYPNWFDDIEYPKNATVKYTDGNIYISLVDNNTALPTDTDNWMNLEGLGMSGINDLSDKSTPDDTDNFALQEVGGDLKKVSFQNLTKLSQNDSRVKTALNASGDAPIYACRAWVNFNGTGTVAIRASGNVSSVTDNGVGNYTVNFTTAMPDSDYGAVTSCTGSSGAENKLINGRNNTSLSNLSCNLLVTNGSGADTDATTISVSIFR